MSPQPREQDLPTGVAGLFGVALNVAAVVALRAVPHTYTPSAVDAWWAETLAAPTATWVSGACFTLGLVALAAFALGLARQLGSSLALVAMVVFASGALLDAAGTLAPVVALDCGPELGKALLRLSLYLDATFNACVGVGLVLVAGAQTRARGWPRGVPVLALAAGLCSLPVAAQARYDEAARLLAVAGPLWLAWVSWTSVLLLRARRG